MATAPGDDPVAGRVERDRLAALARTGLQASSDSTFDRYAQLVRDALGVPVALVSLVDDACQFFPGLAGLEGWAGEQRRTPLSHSFCQTVVSTGEPLVVVDARYDPRVADNLAVSDLGVTGYAGVPLRDVDGFVLGSLCAIDTSPREWTERDLAILTGLGQSCESELRLRAVVQDLSVARADAEAAQRLAETASTRLALLAEVSRVLSSTLDSAETLERLLRLLVPRLADWVVVTDVEPAGGLGLAAGRHRDPALAPLIDEITALQPLLATEDSVVATVARTGEPVLRPVVGDDYADAASQGGHLRELTDRLGLASLLAVPLWARSGVTGVAVLVRQPGSVAFTEGDLEVAYDIGRRAALALENARMHGRQSRAAEVLQRSLLTPMPEPDHLHLVARYLPAAREAQVGGDWYDAFLQPDGCTVLVIGDVVGHDIAAAATMGQIRTMLRSVAYDRGESPADVLRRVDAGMTGLEVDTLATVVVARIEQTPEDQARGLRRLRWSNAGHPPPVIAWADGSVEFLDPPTDLLLGVDHTAPRVDHEVVLPEGATLLLYTDGLVERRNEEPATGLARLRRATEAHIDQPLDPACDGILTAMLPDGSEDDVAVVAVRSYSEERPRPRDAGPVVVPEDRPRVDGRPQRRPGRQVPQ